MAGNHKHRTGLSSIVIASLLIIASIILFGYGLSLESYSVPILENTYQQTLLSLIDHDIYVTTFYRASYGPLVPSGCRVTDVDYSQDPISTSFTQILEPDANGQVGTCDIITQDIYLRELSWINATRGGIYKCWSIDQSRKSCSRAVSIASNLPYRSAASILESSSLTTINVNLDDVFLIPSYVALMMATILLAIGIWLIRPKRTHDPMVEMD